jgi:AbrB family looped-hinge helix DNA binding protein
MSVSTLSTKYQVTLPTALRQALGIKPGDQIAFVMEGQHAVIRSVPKADALAVAKELRQGLKGQRVDVKAALAARAKARYGRGA